MTPPFVETAPLGGSDLTYSIGAMRAYLELCSTMTDRYDQQDRRRGQRYKWLRSIKGQVVPVTPEDMLRHLAGEATYAATYADADGMTMLLVADDDHGGIKRAQAAVDGLKTCGIDAWAIARASIDDLGNPRHNGSKLLIRLAARLHTDDAKRALKALCQLVGYSVDEVMGRAELPFGRSKWTPTGDEYGQLVLAHRAPQRIESGMHGMELLAAADLTPADPDHLMTFAPAKSEPKPQEPVRREVADGTLENTHAAVVAAYNAAYTVHDVFAQAGWRKIGRRNYRCQCGNHKATDRMPSVGISLKDDGAYFNTPGCRYHNDKRGYSPFSLNQTINHGGNFIAAMDEARDLLNMPFKRTRKAAAEGVNTTPVMPKLAPAQVILQDAIDVERIIEEIARRIKAGAVIVGELTTAVLRTICRLARAAGGYAQASYGTLADLSGVSESTARRAVERLERLRFIRKHANATPAGQYAANVLEILPQPVADDHATMAEQGVNTTPVGAKMGGVEQSILSTIKEEECIPAFSIATSPVSVQPDPILPFNSLPAKIQRTARIQTRAEQEAEWAVRFYSGTKADRYHATTAAERKAGAPAYRVQRGTDTYDHPMNRQPDPDMSVPRPRGAIGRTPTPAPVPPIDISPEDQQPTRWRRAYEERVNGQDLPPAPQVTNEPADAEAAPPAGASPSLIAPAKQPAPPTTQQIVVLPRRKIETLADLAQPAEAAPTTLAEITPLLDRAAAAGDKAALVALLDRLPALVRAETAWAYRGALRQAGRMGAI